MPEEATKSIFTSKTFWTNIVALIAMIVQGLTGKQLMDIQVQAAVLAIINVLLRTITSSSVTWK